MTRTIEVNEAMNKCWLVSKRLTDSQAALECRSWMHTLKILKEMGFKRVATEHFGEEDVK